MSAVRRVLLVVLAVAVTVGLAGAPASAQTKTRKDKIGDAPANVDIRSAKVQNNDRNLAVTVRFQQVQRARTSVGAVFAPPTRGSLEDESFYIVGSTPISRGRYATQLYRVENSVDGEIVRARCPGLRSQWKRGARGFGRVVVPQSCLGEDAGRLELFVYSLDKQGGSVAFGARQALRGDEIQVGVDLVESVITTRRG